MTLSTTRIKHLRQERGWSQEHLADAAGIGLRTVQRIETDGTCSPETHMALASAFGVTPKDLLDISKGTEQRPRGLALGSFSGLVLAVSIVVVAFSLSVGIEKLFNLPSLIIVSLLTIALSFMSNGIEATGLSIRALRWLILEPGGATADPMVISSLRRLIQHSYASALIAVLIGLIQMLFHNAFQLVGIQNALAVLGLPLLYGILLSEVVIRPAKFRLERFTVV